ncbi:erythromycin esterase family protein [Streptomyces sp. CG4]|uniref:erythromycin esterase family protein n=1 Tax=Streptomyces sp. CG4 TaxID=408783 RepID=UPI0034E1F27E
MPENMMTKDVKEWLSARALRLRTLEAGGPAADLQPWAGVLKDVRIVGLGEATHGTREFFLLKHRLVEFLVRDLGFRTLAMEAPAAATCSVNAYVLHGTGDARSAVARLGFWTWKTEEVLALVEWMRGYNASVAGDRRVRFVGIDPQPPAPAIGRLDAFLRRVAPERAVALRDVFDLLAAAQPGSHPDSGGRLVGAVRELVEWITADGVRPAAGTGAGEAGEATRAVEDARMLLRAADMASRPLLCEDRKDSGLAARDRHMADAVAEALGEGPGGVVVWAHNGHVLKGRYASGVPALGSHLAMRYGDAYYALGLLFGRGAFRARRGDDAVGPPARHRISGGGLRLVESQLAAACRVDHLVDLRPGKKVPEVNRWLTAGHYMRCFGAGVPRFTYRFQFMPTVLAEEYDGLAYVARSSCSRPLDLPASDGR